MIQIDMPMPTNCLDCPACNEYLMCAIPVNGRKWGENDVSEFSQGRPEWCPMKKAETIVRCKDCLWYDPRDGMCEHHACIDISSPDWFCTDGKRRDPDA